MNDAIKKYWGKYKWSNVYAMIKNMKHAPEKNPEPFRDKLVVITGATSGIGYYTHFPASNMGKAFAVQGLKGNFEIHWYGYTATPSSFKM